MFKVARLFSAAITVGTQQYHVEAMSLSSTLAFADSFLVTLLYASVPAFSFAQAFYLSSANSTPTNSHYFFHREVESGSGQPKQVQEASLPR